MLHVVMGSKVSKPELENVTIDLEEIPHYKLRNRKARVRINKPKLRLHVEVKYEMV